MLIVEYIDQHKHEFGVEPICRTLTAAGTQIAPSTYYAFKTRPRSKRAVRDEELLVEIGRVHSANFSVYGAKKVHAQLRREGISVARCTVERLMRVAGLRGISRAKGPRTTTPGRGPDGRPDLVERDFTATAPNQLWVADITYCRTFAGWVYAAFIIDVFSRRVVGWQLSKSLRTDLALDALEMGIWTRDHAGQAITGLTHHSDKGVQYVAIRYTERLAEAGAVASVGSTGDSYDNALAEAFNSLFKAELVRNRGPWKNIDDLEIATAEYIDWFNHRRLHGEIGMIPPVELEDTYHHNHPAPVPADAALASLYQTRGDSSRRQTSICWMTQAAVAVLLWWGVEARSWSPASPWRLHRLTHFEAHAREMPISAATCAIGRVRHRFTSRRRPSRLNGALACVTWQPPHSVPAGR